MAYPILRLVHLLGLTLMGAGLIGVGYADLRSRQVVTATVLTLMIPRLYPLDVRPSIDT